MPQYNENIFRKTDEEKALSEQKRALRAQKRQKRTNEKLSKTIEKRKHEEAVANARVILDKQGYTNVGVYNRKPVNTRGYDFARINGRTVAVPVTRQGYVPVRAVKGTHAARSPAAIRADNAGKPAKIRYPAQMTAKQYGKWASNPGRSDVIGVDCLDRRYGPTVRSNNMKASAPAYTRVDTSRYHKFSEIKDQRGNTVRIPVNQYGKVSQNYMKEVQASRSKASIMADNARTSKKVMGTSQTPYQARTWILDPSAVDIKGIDAPKDAKVTYVRPKTEEAAKELQRKRNAINGKKGGLATAAKKKAAAPKKAAPKKAVAVPKKAPAKKPAAPKAAPKKAVTKK